MKEEYTWPAFEVDNRNVFVNGIGKDALRYTKVNVGWRLQ